MKKDFFSIEDLAQGRCAVKNDGSPDELRKVLRKAFPYDPTSAGGSANFYFKAPLSENSWFCDASTDLPTQSVKDFLHDFRVGDLATYKQNGYVGTITDISNGREKINFSDGWDRTNVPVDNLTPCYKKGDKAEVVEDFIVLSFKKGDIIEFTDDNIINGFRLSDAVLKDKIKRIRSMKLDLTKTLELHERFRQSIRTPCPERHSHYNNEHGSLYKIAEQLGLNAYEFDILKRIARCRKKGQFKQDLQKIKDTVDLYLKEVEHD